MSAAASVRRLALGLALCAACAAPSPDRTDRRAAPAPGGSPGGDDPAVQPERYRIPAAFIHEVASIACDDGYMLSADFIIRRRLRERVPGVIYLHGHGQERHAFYPLTVMTAGRGFAVLAPDLRGHGENTSLPGNPPTTPDDLTAADHATALQDLRNVISHLVIRGEVDGGRLALVGTEYGANLALAAAAEPWAAAVRCVIAVSPLPRVRGLDAERAAPRIRRETHVYLVAAKDDPDSYLAATTIRDLLHGPRELLEPETGGRGTRLFGRGLIQKIPQWLFSALGNPGAGP